jgi:methylmalonyl-CoA mutase N-terminal domain/subunit
MKIALRTQQIIAEETRVGNVVDPLGGSYYVESLTNALERETFAILDRVAEMGGTVTAIEEGWFQREIADQAYRTLNKRASGEHPVIGVNRYASPAVAEGMQIHRVDPDAERRQAERTQRVRRERDNHKVKQLLDDLAQQARDPSANLMPGTIEAVRARATLGEIVARLKDVFGTYTERPAL